MTLFFLLAAALGRDEAALREAFDREFKAKDARERVEALKKLAGAKEEKTVERLVNGLKDSELDVRKAAAEAIEKSTDGGGLAIGALGDILVDKKQDLDLRLACARALGKARYKAEAIPHFLKTISSIDREEKQFHKFGADVTIILGKYAGKDYGLVRETAERWSEWWEDNQAALRKEDQKSREEWKKEQK
jgi:HEAT repeat protein